MKEVSLYYTWYCRYNLCYFCGEGTRMSLRNTLSECHKFKSNESVTFQWHAVYFFSIFSCYESESEVTQSCPNLCNPIDVAYQAPPYMEFSRQEYLVGCHFLLQGILPTQGLTWIFCIAGRHFTVWATREAQIHYSYIKWKP